MKKKTVKKSKTKPTKKVLSKIETPATSLPVVAENVGPVEVRSGAQIVHSTVPPPPEFLLREAEEEPDLRDLGDYLNVISTLRDKGFSYREIAEWLSERGVEANYNAVYRVYRKSLTDLEAYEDEEAEKREAEEEAFRNR